MAELWFIDNWNDLDQEPVGGGLCICPCEPDQFAELAPKVRGYIEMKHGRGQLLCLNDDGERVSPILDVGDGSASVRQADLVAA